MLKEGITTAVILFSTLAAATSSWAWEHRRPAGPSGPPAITWLAPPPLITEMIPQGDVEICYLVYRRNAEILFNFLRIEAVDLRDVGDNWFAVPLKPTKQSLWKQFLENLGNDGYDHRDRWR